MDDMKRVLVLGAGTMGLQIGVQCAAFGFEVTVYDAFEAVLAGADKKAGKIARRLAGLGRFPEEAAEAVPDRMRFTPDPESAGRDADIISESVPEDPGLKAEVFERFNRICPDHTIFTTNTSTLLPSMIAKATGRPDRFCALHFHDLRTTNVVDIMPHPGTSEATLAGVRAFCTAIDQYPIELNKEQPGYVFNTMLTQWMGAALTLASREVASVQDIDRAWMGIMGSKVGPFGIMDSIGLETTYKVTDYWANKTQTPKALGNAAFLKSYVDRGDLGLKTGKGFYSYPEPEYLSPDFLGGIH